VKESLAVIHLIRALKVAAITSKSRKRRRIATILHKKETMKEISLNLSMWSLVEAGSNS